MMRLTKRIVDALSPRQKQYVEYDTDLTGFGVVVYPSGIKSWVCEYRPHGGVPSRMWLEFEGGVISSL